MKLNLFDSHVHSDNSHDGHHTVTYLCEQAIENHMMGFAITDHIECDSPKVDEMFQSIRQSCFAVEYARDCFGSDIILSKGVELGQPHHNAPLSQQLIAAGNFDFLLGSCHNLADGTDFYYANYSDPDIVVTDMLNAYYDDLLALAVWNGFDAMAHIRYPERYIWGDHRIPVDITPHMERIAEILRTLIANGKALEINTSAMRKGMPGDPGREILTLYKDLGGELITLGSDAHFAGHMAFGFDDMMDLMLDLGFQYFTFYNHREPKMLKLI